jgi:hypothetical protein
MTDQTTGSSEAWTRSSAATPRTAPPSHGAAPDTSAWTAWVRFAAVVMVVVGVFGVIEGLAAILTPTYFVSSTGAVLVLSWAAWGWVHLVLGALVALVGAGLLGEAPSWARGAAVALVALSMIVHLIIVTVAPVWSIVVIALDVVVLYALVTTWGQPLGHRR